jgi:comEA protein
MLLRRIPNRYFFFFLFLGLIVSASTAAGKKKPPAQPVNINTANSEQLQQVPGIGPATANKILQMRKSYGPFKSVDDLLAIRGLGAKRLEKMRKYLTVGQPTPKKTPASWAVPQILHNKKLQSPYRFPSWAMIA